MAKVARPVNIGVFWPRLMLSHQHQVLRPAPWHARLGWRLAWACASSFVLCQFISGTDPAVLARLRRLVGWVSARLKPD